VIGARIVHDGLRGGNLAITRHDVLLSGAATMHKLIIAAALVAAVALPAAGQVTSTSRGRVVPTTSAARVNVKVSPSLAGTVQISADSAFAIARAHAYNGEVSSADLVSEDGHLVYHVMVLNKNKGATKVWVDAMTGATLDTHRHGGLKAPAVHHKENKKLLDAKRDSVTKAP
jgi:uncharacterized membrane protein YkoI